MRKENRKAHGREALSCIVEGRGNDSAPLSTTGLSLHNCLSICLSVCLSVCLSIYLSVQWDTALNQVQALSSGTTVLLDLFFFLLQFCVAVQENQN